MDETPLRYEVRIPMPGQPDGYYTVVRANTPEGAADCVRVLLAQLDREMVEVVVRVSVKL